MNAGFEPCPYRDAVVARHLDGDMVDAADAWLSGAAANDLPAAQAFAGLPADTLTEHLRGCPDCQRHLQQSRRLDAVLAEASGRATSDLEGDPQQLDRLLQRALVLATPRAPATPVRPRRVPRLLWAAGLLGLGYLLALAFGPAQPGSPGPGAAPPAAAGSDGRAPGSRQPAGPEPIGLDVADGSPALPSTLPPAVATGATASRGPWLLPPVPVQQVPTGEPPAALPLLLAPRCRADIDRLLTLLTDRALPERLCLGANLAFVTVGCAVPMAATAAQAQDLRRRASEYLLDTAQPYAIEAWARAVAGFDQGPLLAAVLADARRRPVVTTWLASRLQAAPRRAELDDLALLTTAARLGGRALDAAVRTAVRRGLDRVEVLAAALRTPCPRRGRASLLLDVWGDRVARGADDDEALARTLFTGQPDVADELMAEWRHCRQVPRRLRCLLALGASGDPVARPVLLEALRSPVQSETLAAAWALGGLPAAALADLRPQAERGPQAWLLRAAFCRAGAAPSPAWIEGLELTPAESELFAVGGFTLAQFPVFAALLRERTAATY